MAMMDISCNITIITSCSADGSSAILPRMLCFNLNPSSFIPSTNAAALVDAVKTYSNYLNQLSSAVTRNFKSKSTISVPK